MMHCRQGMHTQSSATQNGSKSLSYDSTRESIIPHASKPHGGGWSITRYVTEAKRLSDAAKRILHLRRQMRTENPGLFLDTVGEKQGRIYLCGGPRASELVEAPAPWLLVWLWLTADSRPGGAEILTKKAVSVPKRINTTRWSCRADATKALSEGYSQFIEALDQIADDRDELAEVRCKARGMSERLCQLETGIYTVFWNDMLQRFNATSKILQNPKLDLNSAVAAIKSLQVFVESKRDSFKEYEKEGIDKSGTTEYVRKRESRRNVRLNPLEQCQSATTQQVTLTQSDTFRIENFLTVIDQFTISLQQRLLAYELVSGRFSFLQKLDELPPLRY